MTTGSDSTNQISRECVYCLFYGWRSDLVLKLCIFYPNVCIILWVRLQQAHGKSELCWSTLKLQLNAFKPKTSFKRTSTVLLIQFRCVFVRARACKDQHHSGGSSSFEWWTRVVNICICLVWIKMSLCGCKCQTLLFQKVDSHCLFSVCSKMAPKLKTGMANKSRLTLLFSSGMGWQSTEMWGGLGSNADVADGWGENSPRRSSLAEAADRKRRGRNQGPTTAKVFTKHNISTTPESAVAEWDRPHHATAQAAIHRVLRWRGENKQDDVDRRMLKWQHTQTLNQCCHYRHKQDAGALPSSWSLKLWPIAKQLMTTQWDNGWWDLCQ